MDIPRLALIAASILLGLMLLGEWTRFSAEQQNAGSTAVPMVDEFAGLDAPAAPDAVAANAMTATAPNTDLPINEDVDLPTLDSVATAAASRYRGNVITVETDVLEVIIDLEGGDVVGAALKAYPKTLDDPSDPFVLLERNSLRTYVAQSGLVGSDGVDQSERARYRAKQSEYRQNGQTPLEVTLEYVGDNSALQVNKVFTFMPGSHTISVRHDVFNPTPRPAQFTPFAQLKRDSSPAPTNSGAGMGMQPFLGSALTQPDQRFTKFDFDDMADDPFKADLTGGWIAMLQHLSLIHI